MMAAKAVLNDLYQRLRSCVVYKTQADADGFVCHLLLPAVECSHPAFAAEQHFEGRGNSKKEAEHAAAIRAVEFLTAENVLWPDAAAGSRSRGTSTASPSASSATSGVSLPGVGSKRSKSNITDPLDEESAESLELRILEALSAVHPKSLNGAQLAKLCGHFKLKSKVNHLLYMKLRSQGLVELLDTHPPAWRAAGRALPAAAAAVAEEAPAAQAPDAAVGPDQQFDVADAAAGHACTQGAAAPALAGGKGRGQSATGRLKPSDAQGSVIESASKTASGVAGRDEPAGEVSSAAPAVAAAAAARAAARTSAPDTGASAAVTSTAGAAAGAGSAGDAAVAATRAAAAAVVSSGNAGAQHQQLRVHSSPQPPHARSSSGKQGSRSPAPAASGAAAAGPARSGSGLRGSCSPVPAAVQGRRPPAAAQQPQPQPRVGLRSGGGVHSIMSPVQSDIGKCRRQHMPRPQQQQQQHLCEYQQQQSHHLQQQQQSVGLDALLLPQTLSGLGLVDSADATFLGAHQATLAAAAAGVRGSSPSQGHAGAAPSGGVGTWTASSGGHAQGNSAGFGPPGICSQQQQQQSHSHGSLPSLPHHAGSPYAPAPAAAAAAGDTGAAAAAVAAHALRRGLAASDSDDEVSPAVLAAASEAASLEPAPFAAAEQSPGAAGSFSRQQQQQRVLDGSARPQLPAPTAGVGVKQPFAVRALLQHVDLLAAMQINERPFLPLSQQALSQPHPQQQQQHQQQQRLPPQPQLQQQQQGPCSLDAVVPDSHMRARSNASSSRAGGEAGIKRKYPAYLSSDGQVTPADATDALAAGPTHAAAAAAMTGAAVQHGVLVSSPAGDVWPAQEHQQPEQQQHQLQESSVSQQQHAAPDADQVHPQRRRRRSGCGDGFTTQHGVRTAGVGAATGGVVPSWQHASAAGALRAAEDEQTGSSDDMQDGDMQQEADGTSSQGAEAAAAAAAGKVFATCGGLSTGVQPTVLQPSMQGGPWPAHGQRPAAAAAVGPGAAAGGHVASSSLWLEQHLGSSSNPWHWQSQQQLWQQQQHQQQHEQHLHQPGQPVHAAGWQPSSIRALPADSEGNGSCLSWPVVAAAAGGGGGGGGINAAVGAGRRPLASIWQQRQQDCEGMQAALEQQQPQQEARFACSGDVEVVRASSPGPCMSGLSVGASAVSGGNNRRGSVEPVQAAAAAAGQEVTQPAPQQLQQQQQGQPDDWLQSEEQALQLLSRLALPPGGCAGAAPGASAAAVDGGAAAAARGGAAAVGEAVQQDRLAAAMAAAAAAAAAAQAAAAVASAAPEQPQRQAEVQMQQEGMQFEYERRVGAVRDLVQQLNEALQGLNSFQQERVGRPGA